jgi:hypothetical protein
MAAPKPKPDRTPDPDDFWTLPPDGSANVMDEERWERMLRLPGVIMHRRDPNAPIEPFVPADIVIPGSMDYEDLMRLLGRRDDEDDILSGSIGQSDDV